MLNLSAYNVDVSPCTYRCKTKYNAHYATEIYYYRNKYHKYRINTRIKWVG